MIDFIYLIAVTIIMFVLIFVNNKEEKKLGKIEGGLLVALYIGYTIYIIMRN